MILSPDCHHLRRVCSLLSVPATRMKRRRVGMADAVVERRRRDPQLIGDLGARPAFLHAFQSAMKQLQAVFPSRYTRSFAANALHAMRSRVSSEDRLLLVSAGRLCAMLARRLLCSNGECVFRNPLRLGTSVLCRRLLVLPSPRRPLPLLRLHLPLLRRLPLPLAA